MRYDYLKEALKVLGAVIVILLIVSLVPDFEIKYKHFNLLSDVVDDTDQEDDDSLSLEAQGNDLMGISTDSIENASKGESTPVLPVPSVDTSVSTQEGVVGFEDFSESKQMLKPFYQALLTEAQKRPVRIGVLGDSFIEADIMTSDLRKHIQTRYGGHGVGFIPIVSPVAQSRKGVQQEATGWYAQSMIYYKKADWSKFSLTGFYYIPSENATVTLKLTEADTLSQFSFVFINLKQTILNVSINGQAPVEYKPETSDHVQFLTLPTRNIQTLKITTTNVEGFTGLGFYRNNTSGVYVDNFSVRGSSGVVLSTISDELSKQLNAFVSYDLLIVEYGLNVMVAEKTTYASYRKLMTKAIEHLKACYPGVPIIVMSVGDRGSKGSDGSVITHPGVLPLVAAQREIAQNAGVLFWNTFQAMGGDKSMVTFVNSKPPMAAKDYTHINYLGGSKIAQALYESLMSEKNKYAPSIGYEK